MCIGAVDPLQKQVTVVGAGIAGMLAAYRLDQCGYEVTVHEAGARAGGLIRTTRTDHGIAESAAHSFLASPTVIDLCAELGVPLVPVGARARYIVRDGRMRRMPLNAKELLGLFWKLIFARARLGGAPSLDVFARQLLGGPALDYLLNPFLRGIYAARPSEIALDAAFPRLRVPDGKSLLALKRSGSRARMMAPAGGMQAITDALESRLRARIGERFRLSSAIETLPASGSVVLAVPAARAAALLAAVDPASSEALKKVRYSPLVSVTVFVKKGDLRRVPDGVGLLVPEVEAHRTGRRSVGVLFNSSAFWGRVAREELVSFTVMLGGTSQPDVLSWDDVTIETVVRSELGFFFGLRDRPAALHIHKWERAIPVYDFGLMDAWKSLRRGWCAKPGHVLFANYTGQISVRGMMEAVSDLGIRRAQTQ